MSYRTGAQSEEDLIAEILERLRRLEVSTASSLSAEALEQIQTDASDPGVTIGGTPSGLANINTEGVSAAAPRLDHQHKRDVRVAKAGVDVGTRNRVNFIDGSNVTITVADDGVADEIDITISQSGGGYTTVQDDGVNETARSILNFQDGFVVTDDGVDSTDVDLDYGAPTAAIDIGDSAAGGSATTVTRTDHQHSFPAPTAGYPIDASFVAEADGVATTPARSDHRHHLTEPAAGYPVDVAATEADGTDTTPARSDHRHAHGSGYLPNAHHNQSHTVSDHTTAINVEEGNVAVGAALTLDFGPGFDVSLAAAEADITLDASEVSAAPTQIDIGDTVTTGAATTFANSAHQHAFPAPAAGYPVDVAATEDDGVTTTAARADHRHAHGSGYLPDAHHPNLQVDVFTADGTWTKKTGVTWVEVWCLAGGGGGGSGRRGIGVGTGAGGGGGGGAGGFSIGRFRATDLGATVNVEVGAGGAGGAAIAVDNTNGNSGAAGGESFFGATSASALVRARQGDLGGGGTSATGGAGGAGGDGTFPGGAGGAAVIAAPGNEAVAAAYLTGGGGGGSLTAAGVENDGGGGGVPDSAGENFRGAGGAAGGGNGGAGSAAGNANSPSAAGGGGGGGSDNNSAAGSGSAGGRGAGGGGGGASANGSNSGAGGAGGAGLVVVIQW